MPLQPVDRERNVRTDRWLQGQLKRLVERADSDSRRRMSEELQQRLERATSSGSPNPLRMFLNLFGFHELGDAARLALIDRLLASEALLEAEVLAGDLLNRADRQMAGSARAALASIYIKARRFDLAARIGQELSKSYRATVLQGGQTGQQAAARILGDEAVAAFAAPWPIGEVEVKENDPNPSSLQRMPYPVAITHFFGAAPRGLKIGMEQSRWEVTVKSDAGQTISTGLVNNANSPNRMAGGYGNVTLTSAQVNGHLVIANLGADVVAIDGLRSRTGGPRGSCGSWRRRKSIRTMAPPDSARPRTRESAARKPSVCFRFQQPDELQHGAGRERRRLFPARTSIAVRRSAYGADAVGTQHQRPGRNPAANRIVRRWRPVVCRRCAAQLEERRGVGAVRRGWEHTRQTQIAAARAPLGHARPPRFELRGEQRRNGSGVPDGAPRLVPHRERIVCLEGDGFGRGADASGSNHRIPPGRRRCDPKRARSGVGGDGTKTS